MRFLKYIDKLKKSSKRMALNIEGIRPALVSKDIFKLLDELRAFRHPFGHAYSYDLDSERVIKLAEKSLILKDLFLRDLANFVNQIKD